MNNKHDQYSGDNKGKPVDSDVFGEELEEPDTDGRETSEDLIIDGPEKDELKRKTAFSGAEKTINKERNNTSTSPDLSSHDIDADWEGADSTGEEASMGTNPTPDQDQVDDIAEPWGLGGNYENSLDIDRKRKKLEEKRKDDEDNSN